MDIVPDQAEDGEQQQIELRQPGENFFTVENAVDQIGMGKFQIFLMVTAGLAWLSDAMEMMLLSIIAPKLKCEWKLSTFQEAFITTVVFIGMAFGSAFWGLVCDKHGRKKGVVLSSFMVLYFGCLSSQAPHYAWILVLRMMVGFSIGGAPQVVTIVTEFLPTKTRGTCIILLEVFWAIGSLFAVSLALITMESAGWRWFLLLSTIPVAVFLILSIWLPESPRYLLTAGKPMEALHVLQKAARINKTTLPEGSLYVPDVTVPRGKLMDLLSSDWRRLTVLLWLIWISSAFSYYGILLLTTEMFQSHINGCLPHGIPPSPTACGCHALSQRDYLDFLWTTAAEFPGLIITLMMIDRIGRKNTLFTTLLLASVFFMAMMICTTRTVSLVFVFAVRALVTGSFQTAYIYTPEVFPTSVRALALGTCSAFARIGAMITPFIAQVLLQSSFYYGVAVYAAVLFASAIACCLLPFDTKGRSLEDTTTEVTQSNGRQTGYNRLK